MTNVRSGRSNAPLLVVYVYVCFVLNFGSVCFIDCWHTIQTIHTHTSTRNTRRGKHAHVTSPFATSPNYAYASSAAGALNKHINIINLHAINAVCMRVCVCVFNVNQLTLPPSLTHFLINYASITFKQIAFVIEYGKNGEREDFQRVGE